MPRLVAIVKRDGRAPRVWPTATSGHDTRSRPKHALAHTAPVVAALLGTRNMETCRGYDYPRPL